MARVLLYRLSVREQLVFLWGGGKKKTTRPKAQDFTLSCVFNILWKEEAIGLIIRKSNVANFYVKSCWKSCLFWKSDGSQIPFEVKALMETLTWRQEKYQGRTEVFFLPPTNIPYLAWTCKLQDFVMKHAHRSAWNLVAMRGYSGRLFLLCATVCVSGLSGYCFLVVWGLPPDVFRSGRWSDAPETGMCQQLPRFPFVCCISSHWGVVSFCSYAAVPAEFSGDSDLPL